MERRKNMALCLCAGVFYLVNRWRLIPATAGWLNWFLVCYANDVAAGAAILAWTDLLLDWGRLPRLHSWRRTVPFLLACGLVWEVLAPLWKPGAVFDFWDLVAYQAGGSVWLVFSRWKNRT